MLCHVECEVQDIAYKDYVKHFLNFFNFLHVYML